MRLHELDLGFTLSVRYRIASKPQSSGMPYCFPPYWPALTMNGLRCLKFEIFDVSHGCTRPLVAKYFTQPTYGRKRSTLSPAWNFASASASFVMYVNCGLFAACCLAYCANIAWPPSFP